MASKALTIAAFGARGTGKTAWVRQTIEKAKPARLLIWDFKHDPGMEGLGTPVRSLPELIRSCKGKTFRLQYLVDHGRDLQTQFDLFCQAAWLAGNVLVFVDELPEVTKANKAPAAWRRIVNIGREYRGQDGALRHISIIGAGQRPAECDKSFISNCDVIHTGRLSHAGDARQIAEFMGCDYQELMRLEDLHWIERRAGEVDAARGKIIFSLPKKTSKTPLRKPPLVT
jgi:hypothetical protein